MLQPTILLFTPFITSILIALGIKKITAKTSQIITIAGMLLATITAFNIAYDVIFNNVIYNQIIFKWFDLNNLNIEFSLFVDSLTALMLVVVTFVSTLVHIYSVGYMKGDKYIPRFMAYLSLFTFAMLLLVTANNLLQLFFGWEGVGLCSYLLIGFWYNKDSANKAAMKAFIVNRVGDLFFIAGMGVLLTITHSLNFSEIFQKIDLIRIQHLHIFGNIYSAIDVICICLFIGCMAKSAQIFLHIWLPDAMEGPTPVSALIHAATMVTAGIFLVARLSPLFEYSESARTFILVVGSLTAIFAGLIALVQNDIKKIIAYSTCSQLGYMFVACGLSMYNMAIFHLFTHAFFKALLFLGAGSVIHSMHHEQDINKMGALYNKLPFTYIIFWIGSIAIAGFPPLSGYYSKEHIINAALISDSKLSNFAYYMTVLGGFCTSFYSWRLLIKVFHGKANYDNGTSQRIHESPFTMAFPLILLAIFSIIIGYLAYHYLGIIDADLNFWNNSIVITEQHNIIEKLEQTQGIDKYVAKIWSVFGVILALIIYNTQNLATKLTRLLKPIYTILSNKFYFDEIYKNILVKTYINISNFSWNFIDTKLIDNNISKNLIWVVQIFASRASKLQNGLISSYALIMLLGFVLILTAILLITNF
jgi:NADH-quinone oxidoreductase subunit L